jgi:NADH-quinone oxidoreductase subunit M
MLSTLTYLLILAPLLAAGIVALSPARLAKWIATFGSLAILGIAVAFAIGFPNWDDGGFAPSGAGLAVMPSLGVTLSLGTDSVGLLLILLTTFLMPLAMIGSFSAVREREREYYAWFMVLEAAMLGVFLAQDAIVFYTAYEFTLVPMYFLIAIYGGPERRAASVKFFLYTFLGSMLTLSGVIYIAAQRMLETGAWSFDLAELAAFSSESLSGGEQFWVFILLMAGFAVKVPFFPVHTWLPLAHDQAPTAGSVILAGTLLKLGTYGVYRIALPAAPVGGVELNQVIAVLCVIGIVHAALICWVQHDAKKLIAYSSVSHLGFCMLGLFSLNSLGATGSVMYMINHGLSTGALFLCIGMIYERYHTKDMDQLGGLFKRMPVWSFFMVFFTLASLGLPGLNGFIGEFLCLMGAYTAEPGAMTGYPGLLGPWWALVAGLGLVLAAMYLLIMLGKLVWGPLREPLREPNAHGHGHAHGHAHGHGDGHGDGHGADHGHGAAHASDLPADLNAREIGILVPLAVLCLAIGFYPKPMLDAISPSVDKVLAAYPKHVERYVREGTLLDGEDAAPQGVAVSTPSVR